MWTQDAQNGRFDGFTHPEYPRGMKVLLGIMLGLLASCGPPPLVVPEGFEHGVVWTISVMVGQGQQCTSDFAELRLAAKYPSRLPKGVTIETITPGEWRLTAAADAPKDIPGHISSGTRVVVSEPRATLSPTCELFSMPI